MPLSLPPPTDGQPQAGRVRLADGVGKAERDCNPTGVGILADFPRKEARLGTDQWATKGNGWQGLAGQGRNFPQLNGWEDRDDVTHGGMSQVNRSVAP